jgi:undecaprenyl-diphosphatase
LFTPANAGRLLPSAPNILHFKTMNETLFVFINQFAGTNTVLDKLGIILAEYTPYFYILILIYFWLSQKPSSSTLKNITLLAGYSAGLGIIINRIISSLYFHPRPFMENIGTLLIKHTAESSFPSDHTTFLLSIAFLFVYFSQTKKLGLILIVLGIISGFARVFAGLHFPLDILGSLLISIFSATIIFHFKNNLQKTNTFLINGYLKMFK